VRLLIICPELKLGARYGKEKYFSVLKKTVENILV
jgi:hypothetical protein